VLFGAAALLLFIAVARLAPRAKGPPCSVLAAQGAREIAGRCVVAQFVTTRHYSYSRLPDNLTVNGLELWGTGVTELPRGLRVNGDLELFKCDVEELPEELVVNGSIHQDLSFFSPGIDCKHVPKTVRVSGTLPCY